MRRRHDHGAHDHGHAPRPRARPRPRPRSRPRSRSRPRPRHGHDRAREHDADCAAAADVAGLAGPAGGRLQLLRGAGGRHRRRRRARRGQRRGLAARPVAARPGRSDLPLLAQAHRGLGGARRRPRIARSTTGCWPRAKPTSCGGRAEQMGRSMLDWLRQRRPDDPRLATLAAAAPAPAWPIAFALAAAQSGAAARDALLAFAFGWAENMVQAALKAVPLGQSGGQRILGAPGAAIAGGRRRRAGAARRRAPGLHADARDPVGATRNPVLEAVPLMSSPGRPKSEFPLGGTARSAKGAPCISSTTSRTKKLPPLRVGVGGPVGSGKTTLVEKLCKTMRERWDLVVVTNDIYTKEDQRLLTVAGALDARTHHGRRDRRLPAHRDPRGRLHQPRGRRPHAREVPRRRHRLHRVAAATTWPPPSAPSCPT